MRIKLITFGNSHRHSQADWPLADYYFSCLGLANPKGELYNRNGTDPDIKLDLATEINKYCSSWWGSIWTAVTSNPVYTCNPDQLTVAFYCSGGRHRSVGTAEIVRDVLISKGYIDLSVTHEDIHKSAERFNKFLHKPHATRTIGFSGIDDEWESDDSLLPLGTGSIVRSIRSGGIKSANDSSMTNTEFKKSKATEI